MPLTNLFRAFGSDVLLVLCLALPLLVVYVLGRSRLLTRSHERPNFVALLEALIALSAIGVATVTLIPSGAASGEPRSVDWSLLTSDLSYAPERTQVLGNLVLFMPLVALLTIRAASRRLGLLIALLLPGIVELIQYLAVAGRASTLEDWLLGSLGGVVAVGMLTFPRRRPSDATRASAIVRDAGARVGPAGDG